MKKTSVALLLLCLLLITGCGGSGGGGPASVVTAVSTVLSPIVTYNHNSEDSSYSTVSISCSTNGATIRYTTDGSEPTPESTIYSGSFSITTGDQIVKAKAFKEGCTSSDTITESIPVGKKALTIMYYGDADNNLENSLLKDVEEMKEGYANANYNLITLFDRGDYSNDSSVFGEDFSDTRLYKIGSNKVTRLNGWTQMPEIKRNSNYEANMGDAATLQKFIKYCKANYPANKYMLIMSNHGGGTRNKALSSKSSTATKAICWDETNENDTLYTAEVTDILTSSESVDVLVLDACLMGSVEYAYQYRPENGSFSADYMVASPAIVWGNGLPYDKILGRLNSSAGNNGETDTLNGGTEAYIVPSLGMSMSDFSKMIVEEQYDSVTSAGDTSQTFSVYDLSKVSALKTVIDNFAVSVVNEDEKTIFESVRGTTFSNTAMNYFKSNDENEWSEYPFFDIYDLARKVEGSTSFTAATRGKATLVKNALSDVILSSFGGSDFKNANDGTVFANNKNGMHIVFPKLSYTVGISNYWSLATLRWYTPVDMSNTATPYGKLKFCGDNASENGSVENWFEMIDKWYDNTAVNSGEGFNLYAY